MEITMDNRNVDTETGEIRETAPQKPQERRRDRDNTDFVMFFRRFINQVADLGIEDAQALKVLLFLVRHMDPKNAIAVPMNLMAEMLGLSRQTISQKIKFLFNTGWIAVYRLGRQNVYVVNPDIFWTSYADQKEYCEFTAKVMLSSEDNWHILRSERVGVRHIDKQVLTAMAKKEFPEPEEQD